ncbi:MAG: AP2 domain-containing protein [Coriobacteriia bacterium]|nr:AP2 domain-containing protein [Coriobacteriia bacterium]
MPKYEDLTGKTFGRLTVVEITDQRLNRYAVWRCVCACGGECLASSKQLKVGTIADCGCVSGARRKDLRHEDLTGREFGRLTVVGPQMKENGRMAWECECTCGNTRVATTGQLLAGRLRSCGCASQASGRAYRDLVGQRFGRLVALERTEMRDSRGSIIWRCACDCGNEFLCCSDSLVRGNTRSCGCAAREWRAQISEKLHRSDGTCIERLLLSKPRNDSGTGLVGVTRTRSGRYAAFIGFKGQRYHLGTYETIEEAAAAREDGEQLHLDYLRAYIERNPEVVQRSSRVRQLVREKAI